MRSGSRNVHNTGSAREGFDGHNGLRREGIPGGTLSGFDHPRHVETLGGPYYKRVPLPRVPEYRDLSQDSHLTKPSVKSQPLNKILSAIIPTDIVRYLDVDERQSHLHVSDYHTLDIDIIFI